MNNNKKLLHIAAVVLFGVICTVGGTFISYAFEDPNAVNMDANITGIYDLHFDGATLDAYDEISIDQNRTVCSEGGEAVYENGVLKTTTSYQEHCDIYVNINPVETDVYGIKRNINQSSSAWTRTDKAQNLSATATIGGTAYASDFDNIYPWSEIKSYNINPATGQITAWYGDSNFKFDGSNGEVMTYIPEFYIHRYMDNGYEYIQITRNPRPGFQKIESFSVGRYDMSYDTKAHSISGAMPKVSTNITTFRNYAKALGSGWGQMDWRYFVLQYLYLVEYADYNSQTKLGKGNTNNSAAIANGGCNSLGMQSGSVTNDGYHCVTYRGIENIFGNVYQFIDGINFKDYVAYINYDPGSYQVDKFNGNYTALGYTNSSVNGYPKQMGYDASNQLFGFPTEVGGGTTTYVSDYYYTASGNRILLAGGYWFSGSGAGLFYLGTGDTSSYSGVGYGSRLLRYRV